VYCVVGKFSELWQTVSACEFYGISSESAIHTKDSKTLDVTKAAPSHQAQLVTHHNESRFSWPQLFHTHEFLRLSERNSSCASHNKRPSAAKMRSLYLIAGDVEKVNVGTC